MEVKKVRRTSLKRSLFVGLIGVVSVLGIVSVGFASWSFANTQTSYYVGVDADSVFAYSTTTGLGSFGINVEGNPSVNVGHFKYSVLTEEEDEEGNTTSSYVDYDIYGDLDIHSDLNVDLNYSSVYADINSIDFDDPDYKYLKIQMLYYSSGLLNVEYNYSRLSLTNVPHYYLEPEAYEFVYGTTTFYFYIPLKSSNELSLYTLACIDRSADIESSYLVPFDLDFSFNLSNGYKDNRNLPTEIHLTYTLIGENDYEQDMYDGLKEGWVAL